MGKTPIYDWKSKYNILKKLDLFDEDGELKKQRSPVWAKAYKKFKEKLERQSIYLDVLHNRGPRGGIHTALKEYAIKKGKIKSKPGYIDVVANKNQPLKKQNNEKFQAHSDKDVTNEKRKVNRGSIEDCKDEIRVNRCKVEKDVNDSSYGNIEVLKDFNDILNKKRKMNQMVVEDDIDPAKKRKVVDEFSASSDEIEEVVENIIDKNNDEFEKLSTVLTLIQKQEVEFYSDSDSEWSNEESNEKLVELFEPLSRLDTNPLNLKPLRFDIHLNKREWLVIKPVQGRLKKRKWAPIIAKKVFAATKLECSTSFKVGKVYSVINDTKYIDFYGFCKELICRAYIYGVCRERPKKGDDGIIFEIHTYDTKHIVHKLKRFWADNDREAGKEKLRYTSASQYRQELVNEYMDYSDPEPSYLPSLSVLRGAKVEAMKEYLGIHGPKHPVDCLLFLMTEFPFITEVCANPFRVWYRFEDQIKIWNDSATINSVVTIDATGSFVKKIEFGEEKSSDIFLYQLMTIIDHNYVPLSQMISSRHDTNVVYAFLQEWIRHVNHFPLSTVSDGSLVLLQSQCETLNDCTLQEYLVECDEYLGDPDNKVLSFNSAIRMDRAHVIKNSTNWKCIKESKDQSHKDFYPRTIALACKSKSFHEVMEIFEATIIVCESKYMPPQSVCFEKYSYLLNKIENFDEDELSDEALNKEEHLIKLENSQEDIETYVGENDLKARIVKRYEDVKNLAEANDKLGISNSMHLSDLKNNLIYLYSLYPLWTSVMVPHFEGIEDVATSGGNESYFKDLRRYIKGLHGAPSFILQHANIISAQVKIAKARLKKLLHKEGHREIEKEISSIESQLSSISINVTEQKTSADNIPTENKCPNIVQNSYKFNQSCIEPEFINLSDAVHNAVEDITRPVKKNPVIRRNETAYKTPTNDSPKTEKIQTVPGVSYKGVFYQNLINGGKISIEDEEGQVIKTFILSNTCAYDSIFYLCCHSYETNDDFKNYIDANRSSNSLFFNSIIGYCSKTMDMYTIYVNRALILQNYSQSSGEYLNCLYNVTTLFNNLLTTASSCIRKVVCSRLDCNHERLEKCRSLIVQVTRANEIIQKGHGNIIEHCIHSTFDPENVVCRKCKYESSYTTVELGSFLAIDIDDVFKDCTIRTNNIPVSLNIQGVILQLSGFVVYDPRLAHYYTYCYHQVNRTYEIKNDMSPQSKFEKIVPQNIKLSLLLYVRSCT